MLKQGGWAYATYAWVKFFGGNGRLKRCAKCEFKGVTKMRSKNLQKTTQNKAAKDWWPKAMFWGSKETGKHQDSQDSLGKTKHKLSLYKFSLKKLETVGEHFPVLSVMYASFYLSICLSVQLSVACILSMNLSIYPLKFLHESISS